MASQAMPHPPLPPGWRSEWSVPSLFALRGRHSRLTQTRVNRDPTVGRMLFIGKYLLSTRSLHGLCETRVVVVDVTRWGRDTHARTHARTAIHGARGQRLTQCTRAHTDSASGRQQYNFPALAPLPPPGQRPFPGARHGVHASVSGPIQTSPTKSMNGYPGPQRPAASPLRPPPLWTRQSRRPAAASSRPLRLQQQQQQQADSSASRRLARCLAPRQPTTGSTPVRTRDQRLPRQRSRFRRTLQRTTRRTCSHPERILLPRQRIRSHGSSRCSCRRRFRRPTTSSTSL